MGGFSTPPIDVREMLCAQALAVVAQAVGRAALGTSLTILYSTEDVRQDLLVWARDQGHDADAQPDTLTLTKRR